MKEEQKQLLLKDLCSRLPYGVRYKGDRGWGINPYQHNGSLCDILTSEEPLVYLRPMSSMTEEEREEYKTHMKKERIVNVSFYYANYESYDWLNAHHFDYRGLIEKGLAIDCTNLDIY